MHLRDAAGGEWGGANIGELSHFFGAKILLNSLFDDVKRYGVNIAMKFAQLIGELGRQQVFAHRKDLSKLYKRWAELFKGFA